MVQKHTTPLDLALPQPHFFRQEDGTFVRPSYRGAFIKRLASTITDEISDQVYAKSYGLALKVLTYHFGAKWILDHVFDVPDTGFFGRYSKDMENDSAIIMHRIIDLAELVVNISAEGVEAPFNQVACGEIESGYSELEAGRLLMSCERPFRFVIPSIKGESYDLEYMADSGSVVHCDVKCKIESRPFKKNCILDSLNTARKRNLPKGRPCAVILKLPQMWLGNKDLGYSLADECNRFFRGTRRIVSVAAYFSLVDTNETMAQHRILIEMPNKNNDFGPETYWGMMKRRGEMLPLPPNWLRLESFL